MSDTQTKEEVKLYGLDASLTLEGFPVTRNGASLNFVPAVYQRSASKGRQYYNGEINEETLQDGIKFLSPETAASWLGAKFAQVCQELTEYAIDSDGVFSQEKFAEAVENLKVRGESIPVLEARQIELVNLMARLPMINADGTPNLDAIQLYTKYGKEVKENTEAIADKRRKTTTSSDEVAA